MALHNCTGKRSVVWMQPGLGYWPVRQEVLSRTVHAKLMGERMPSARVCWRGVARQMPHKKSIKNGVEKISNLKGKDIHLNK